MSKLKLPLDTRGRSKSGPFPELLAGPIWARRVTTRRPLYSTFNVTPLCDVIRIPLDLPVRRSSKLTEKSSLNRRRPGARPPAAGEGIQDHKKATFLAFSGSGGGTNRNIWTKSSLVKKNRHLAVLGVRISRTSHCYALVDVRTTYFVT